MLGGEYLLILFNFIFSLYLLVEKRLRTKNSSYLVLIAIISLLSIILTATRVWFVSYAFILLGILFLVPVKRRAIGFITLLIPMVFLPYTLIPKFHSTIDYARERISSLYQPDAEENSITERVETLRTQDFPPLWEGINNYPVFGTGFSNEYYARANSDLGNINLIYQVGFLGFSVFLIIWLAFIMKVNRTRRRLSRTNPYNHGLIILNLGFISTLIPHFTTTQIYGPALYTPFSIFISTYIFFTGYAVRESIRLEHVIRKTSPVMKRY